MSLNMVSVNAAVVRPGALWREIRAVAETGSTNSDLLALAHDGAPEGIAVVAESQTAGRGRRGRHWVSTSGTGLTFSVLLRPAPVPASRLSWLPLLAGVAAAHALRSAASIDAALKWPNDVLTPGQHRKLAGILAENHAGAVVIGFGINVSQRQEELPVPGATSVLAETGKAPQRETLLAAVLTETARWYLAWRDQADPGDPDACGVRAEYQRMCATLGRQVTVTLPGGQILVGTAAGIDETGQLEVSTTQGPVRVSAGDVVHVR